MGRIIDNFFQGEASDSRSTQTRSGKCGWRRRKRREGRIFSSPRTASTAERSDPLTSAPGCRSKAPVAGYRTGRLKIKVIPENRKYILKQEYVQRPNFKNPPLYWNVSPNVSIFRFILEKDARWRLCVVRVRRACLMRWVEASVATPVDFRELSEGILAGASDRCTARSFPLVVKRPLRCEASNYQYSRLRVLHQLNSNQDRSCVAYRWSRHW